MPRWRRVVGVLSVPLVARPRRVARPSAVIVVRSGLVPALVRLPQSGCNPENSPVGAGLVPALVPFTQSGCYPTNSPVGAGLVPALVPFTQSGCCPTDGSVGAGLVPAQCLPINGRQTIPATPKNEPHPGEQSVTGWARIFSVFGSDDDLDVKKCDETAAAIVRTKRCNQDAQHATKQLLALANRSIFE